VAALALKSTVATISLGEPTKSPFRAFGAFDDRSYGANYRLMPLHLAVAALACAGKMQMPIKLPENPCRV
jgi:hypothetical protein